MSRFLETKYFTPPVSRHWIERTSLSRKLSAANTALVLLQAPGGYGKTTAVSHWLTQQQIQHVWITLDARDNTPGEFWKTVAGAFLCNDSLHVPFTQDAFEQSASVDSEQLIQCLLNDLGKAFANHKQSSLVLVLDDFQFIDNATILTQFGYFLDYLPNSLRVMITSRTTPDLGLSKRRARQQVSEIRVKDLAFKYADTKQLINEKLKLNLDRAALAQLHQRTEGWVAALHLAAYSMKESDNPRAFVNDYSGNQSGIAEYLTDEILTRLPERSTEFLIKTSFLPKLNAELGAQITGFSDCGLILQTLFNDGLFLTPLDEQGNWFQCHDLVREYLLRKIPEDTSFDLNTAKYNAALWYQQHDHYIDAIELFIASGDWLKSTALIQEKYSALKLGYDRVRISRWLTSIPVSLSVENPKLIALQVWSTPTEQKNQRHLQMLDQAEKQLTDFLTTPDKLPVDFDTETLDRLSHLAITSTEDYCNLLLDILTLKQHQLGHTGEFSEAIALGQRILTMIGDQPASPKHYRAVGHLSVALFRHLDFLTAKQHLSKEFNNKYATRSIEDVIGNVIYLDLLFWHLGLLSQSQAIHQEYLHWAEQSIWKGSIITCLHTVSQAEILREMNQLDQAKELLDEALTLLSEKMLDLSLQDHIVNLLYCRLLLSRRDYETFNKAVSELESLYQHGSFNWHFGFQSVAAMKVQAALGQNNVALAKQLLTAIDVNNTGDLLVQASVQILDAPSDATWQTILDIAARAEHTGNKAWEIQSLQLQAIYLQNCGQSCDANKQFAKALKLAKQHGYVRLLIEEPVHFTSLVSLLQAALDNNTESSYAKKLLNLLNTGTSKKPVAKAGKKKSLLSKRESQILCYLPEGTSNRDIASQLCITEGTVKWYLNKIYEKLEVKNRTHAVIAAQKKGLLD